MQKILFVHNNYPAQFHRLSEALARRNDIEMAAIGSPTARALPSVRLTKYVVPDSDVAATHPFARRFDAEARRAEQVLYAASNLKQAGFEPDLVIGHPGWGEMLPLRPIFPKARIVTYCEFYYHFEGQDVGFDPEFPDMGIDGHVNIQLKNAATLLALDDCDVGLSPTLWQRSTYPKTFQSKIEVIHDGIDTDAIQPREDAALPLRSGRVLTRADEVMTYATRSHEPLRGIHCFLRALPKIMAARPTAQILIIGGSGNPYGLSPPEGHSWRSWFFREIEGQVDSSRIHLVDNLPRADFLAALQISSAHVYFTYPFVLSWSLLEAMSAGCLVIGSDTPPVREMIDGENGVLVPFFDVPQLADRVIEALTYRRRFAKMRKAARETVASRYDLKSVCLPRLLDFYRIRARAPRRQACTRGGRAKRCHQMNAAPSNRRLAALVDPKQHPSALERAAIAALSSGDLGLAYKLADRRCRILPTAQARHYTLRAEIAYRRGFLAEARTDVRTALELAPDDRAANRRMMQWGEGEDREVAARRLINIDHDFDALAAAVLALKASDDAGFGTIRRIGDRLAGWVAWQGRTRPCLQIEHGERIESHLIESDPEHPLADAAEHAASFNVSFIHGAPRSVARLLLGRHAIAQQVFPAPLGRPKAAADATAPPGGTGQVTIIVPIYDDFDLTERCLESLMRAVNNDSKTKVLLVDDATPDPNIADLLDTLASQPKVQLLRNQHNLGFIGAVNRALRTIATDDVILLNSDTIVPNDFVSRLKAAAYAASDIGTVTPLSNNGEATSLPRPFAANPLPDAAEIRRLDAIAARANAGETVDMPDGIGFCLYIKRACLDAVGGLSEHYHRGYLEDVDLCLRARENGFRNICATSVYVGHAGSASFKSEKRALVVLNRDRLQLRFPHYRTESATFKALDPLKVARAAIERSLAADHRDAVVVLTGPGAPAAAAVQFAKSCSQRALIATLERGVLSLRDAGDGFPQSLNFALPTKRSALLDAVRSFAFSHVVVADPARIPQQVATDLAANGTPVDLLVADGGLWCRCGGLNRHRNPCAALTRGKACGCQDLARARPHDWLAALKNESRIIAPDAIAAAFLRQRLPSSRAKQIHLAGFSDRMQRPRKVASRGTTFGLLVAGHAPADFFLMLQLVRRIRQTRPRSQIAIVGETLDDLALIGLGNVTVTGAFAVHELPTLAKHYGLGGLAIARRAPLFGQPVMAAAFCDTDVPLALVDWSFGSVRFASGDLAIAPASSENAIVTDLLAWSEQW